MENDADGCVLPIPEGAFQNGIYYWANSDTFNCLKQVDSWGVTYQQMDNIDNTFNTCRNEKNQSVCAEVVNFLPGGIANTHGVAFGKWVNIDSYKNDGTSELDWTHSVQLTVGFEKDEMSTIEQSWSIGAGVSAGPGDLTSLFFQFQYSLDGSFGGMSENTTSWNYNETVVITDTLQYTIDPGKSVYVWQYQMGNGNQTNLFYNYMALTSDDEAPTGTPGSSSEFQLDAKRQSKL